jgi:glycosyltransferase involved in cell wall biosynthesis
MFLKCLVLKKSSARSKGILCLRLNGSVEPFPRDFIKNLKNRWYLLWFSTTSTTLKDIPYHDLIDIFLTWEDVSSELARSGRKDYVMANLPAETAEPLDDLFYPIDVPALDIDLLYIARFCSFKRYDIALKCAEYLLQRQPTFNVVFLQSRGSDAAARDYVLSERKRLRIESRLAIMHVPQRTVNSYLNRAKLSLFTSDDEGACRAVLQSLLCERPILCYRNTRAQTRLLYDERYFYFYNEQTQESVGRSALDILMQRRFVNIGARHFLLGERGVAFYDLEEWHYKVLEKAQVLYQRDQQPFAVEDILPIRSTERLYQLFEVIK